MRRSPMTKLGTQTPVIVTAAKATSLAASRRAAASTPAGIAIKTDTKVAESASWRETGTRSRRSRATGSRENSDRPISPRSSRPNQRTYCSCTGKSSPRLDLISRTCSADASVPAIKSTGSPGTSLTSTNTILATTHQIGTTATTRRNTYPIGIRPSRSYQSTIMSEPQKSGGVWQRGRGVRSPDPYLLRSLFEAQNHNLVAGQSGLTERNSAWSGERTPRPRCQTPPASGTPSSRRSDSTSEPDVPEVVEVRIPHLDAPELLAVRLDIRRVADDDERDLVHDHGLRLRVERLALLARRFLARLFYQPVVAGFAVHTPGSL